jgi:hypothetical protein
MFVSENQHEHESNPDTNIQILQTNEPLIQQSTHSDELQTNSPEPEHHMSNQPLLTSNQISYDSQNEQIKQIYIDTIHVDQSNNEQQINIQSSPTIITPTKQTTWKRDIFIISMVIVVSTNINQHILV